MRATLQKFLHHNCQLILHTRNSLSLNLAIFDFYKRSEGQQFSNDLPRFLKKHSQLAQADVESTLWKMCATIGWLFWEEAMVSVLLNYEIVELEWPSYDEDCQSFNEYKCRICIATDSYLSFL